MKIKVDQKIFGVDGIEALKADKGRDLTFKDVAISSLLPPLQDDDDKKKFARYEIFKKLRDDVSKEGTVELSVEDIAIIKRSIGKHQPPLIMGQCYDVLEAE